MPAVSVIMPVYNAERFLEQAVDSVLVQTLGDIELIAVNDGSTDASLDTLLDMASRDGRVIVRNGPNGGYGHAMNAGLVAAAGDYVAILEPDDYYDPEFLRSMLDVALRHDADIVKSSYWEHSEVDGTDRKADVLDGRRFLSVTNAMQDPSLVLMRPCIWTAIYRRRMLTDNLIRFDETPGASFQDTAFAFATWMHAQRVVLVPDAYVHYRIDNDASSVHSGGKVFAICDEFKAMEALANSRKEWREEFMPMLVRLKLNSYGWNHDRLAPESKEVFRQRAATEFMQARDEGFLDRNLYDDAAWERVQWFLDGIHGDSLDVLRQSASYRLGHAMLQPARKAVSGVRLVREAVGKVVGRT